MLYTSRMTDTGQIAERWKHKPPPLPKGARRMPDPYSILLLEVMWAFWDILVFEHMGKPAKAEVARCECRKAADHLRCKFDAHPEVGPEAADAMIAWQVHYARKLFASDVARGDWSGRPGQRRGYQ